MGDRGTETGFLRLLRVLKGYSRGTQGELTGTQVGDRGTETGFLRLFNVRIPRDWMMRRNQEVPVPVRARGTLRGARERLEKYSPEQPKGYSGGTLGVV